MRNLEQPVWYSSCVQDAVPGALVLVDPEWVEQKAGCFFLAKKQGASSSPKKRVLDPRQEGGCSILAKNQGAQSLPKIRVLHPRQQAAPPLVDLVPVNRI